MARPWLSVIMPTYNGAAFLPCALDSVVAQGDPRIEVLIVDDGSTDGTLDVAGSYANRLPLAIVRRPHTGNWVSSTNEGMKIARGEYLCWLHQDDAWRPRRLATLRRLLDDHRGASLVVHPCRFMDCAGRRVGYWHCPLPNSCPLVPARVMLERLLVQNFVATPSAIFRADAVAEVGPLDERLTYAADWDFWLRLARLGPALYHPSPLADFRIHAGSQTLARAGSAGERRAELHAVLDRRLPGLASVGVSRETAAEVARIARFSVEVNHALAGVAVGGRAPWRRLAADASRLGLSGWHRYLRDSRVVERCLGRWSACAFDWRGRILRVDRSHTADDAQRYSNRVPCE